MTIESNLKHLELLSLYVVAQKIEKKQNKVPGWFPLGDILEVTFHLFGDAGLEARYKLLLPWTIFIYACVSPSYNVNIKPSVMLDSNMLQYGFRKMGRLRIANPLPG